MATATALLYKNYQSKDHTYPIVIRLNNGKERKFHNIDYKLEEKYWKDGRVVKHPDAEQINSIIADLLSRAKLYFAECKRDGRPVNLSLVFAQKKSSLFTDYLLLRAKQYGEKDSPEMKIKLTRFAKELELFNGAPVGFDQVTANFLRNFENYLISIGNSANTRAKRYDFLRRMYGNAIDEGLAQAPNPFKSYHIKTTKPQKEKLTFDEVSALEALALRPGPVNNARNLFLFSYYCRGARFNNCITMRWSDIKEGRLSFEGVKGGKHITVKIHEKMQGILDQYEPSGEFIFPIVESWPKTRTEQRNIVGPANVVVNRNLKIVAQLAGITKTLTFHMARHTIAYHLKMTKANIHEIKDTLAHSDTKTTEVYLKSLDDSYLDAALDKVYNGKL